MQQAEAEAAQAQTRAAQHEVDKVAAQQEVAQLRVQLAGTKAAQQEAEERAAQQVAAHVHQEQQLIRCTCRGGEAGVGP